MCDCVRACVCVLSPSVRPWLGRRRGGDFKTGRGKEQRQLGMSEPLSCEERGGFCAVRTLSERCQNTVRTLSERCQNGQVSVRTGVGAPQTRLVRGGGGRGGAKADRGSFALAFELHMTHM